MVRPSLKHTLRAGRLTIGAWVTLAHPALAEILARAGFEWVVVDLEHSVITLREAEELIRVIALCGSTPLVRVSANEPTQIKRVMDAGAHGVIVPQVNSRAEAESAVAAVYYPPRGRRGVGLARAQGYGTTFEAYCRWLDRHALVIVQLEHRDAAEAAEEILSVPGVDGYLIGPYDLSASFGVPGQFHHPAVQSAMRRIRQAARHAGVPGGVHVIQPDVAELVRHAKAGFSILAYSLDILLIGATARRDLALIHRQLARRNR